MTIYISLVSFFMINAAVALDVQITTDIETVTVMHNGEEMEIKRHQDKNNQLKSEFTKTSRSCPPFCIKPMIFAKGIETIAELELLDYLKKVREGDHSILVIDSRTPDWVIKGSIPGAISIPWDVLSGAKPNQPIVQKFLKDQFGVKITEKGKSFDTAKTLVLFCNGSWCDQSTTNIKTLLMLGYPTEKLKWYRGGMQAWESLGLSTVTDIPMPWLGL